MLMPSRELDAGITTHGTESESRIANHFDLAHIPFSEQKMIAKHSDFDASRELNRTSSVALHCKLCETMCSAPVHDHAGFCRNRGPERSQGFSIISGKLRACNANRPVGADPYVDPRNGLFHFLTPRRRKPRDTQQARWKLWPDSSERRQKVVTHPVP